MNQSNLNGWKQGEILDQFASCQFFGNTDLKKNVKILGMDH